MNDGETSKRGGGEDMGYLSEEYYSACGAADRRSFVAEMREHLADCEDTDCEHEAH